MWLPLVFAITYFASGGAVEEQREAKLIVLPPIVINYEDIDFRDNDFGRKQGKSKIPQIGAEPMRQMRSTTSEIDSRIAAMKEDYSEIGVKGRLFKLRTHATSPVRIGKPWTNFLTHLNRHPHADRASVSRTRPPGVPHKFI